jgi:hypothetical protein
MEPYENNKENNYDNIDTDNIYAIKIKLFTNINKKNKDTDKNDSILFTRDMLYIDKNIKNTLTQQRYEKYPLISKNYKIMPNIIYKNYDFLYNFFFSYNYFTNNLKTHSEFSDEKPQSEIIQHNIDILLRALFPLFSKTSEGYYTSLNLISNSSNSNDSNIFSFYNIIDIMKKKMNFSNEKYSILNISNNLYTVKKMIWLNDFVNNSFYNDLLVSYGKFKKWLNDYAINDPINYTMIKTKTFQKNYTDYIEKKNSRTRYINPSQKIIDSKNPFFMEKVGDLYLNYEQFYNVIKKYSENKSINNDLQNVIDGGYNIIRTTDTTKYESMKNQFLDYLNSIKKIIDENKPNYDNMINEYGKIKSSSEPKSKRNKETIERIDKYISNFYEINNKIDNKLKQYDNFFNEFKYKDKIFKTFMEEKNNLKKSIMDYITNMKEICDHINIHYHTIGDNENIIKKFEALNIKMRIYEKELNILNSYGTNKSNDIFKELNKFYFPINEETQVKEFYDTMDVIYNLRVNIPDKYNNIIAVKTNEAISLNNLQKIGIIEIEVIMDFIKGKLDNENYSKIKCSYISNDLGNEITNAVFNINRSDKDFLKNSNFLYSVDENQLKKLDSKSKSITPMNKNNNYNLKNKKGGKTKINKKIKHKKTRKNI